MAERIEQQFLIDAAKAIDTLVQLDKAFKGFEQRLVSVSQSVSNFNSGTTSGTSGIASLSKQLTSASAAAAKLASSSNSVASSAAKINGNNITSLTQGLAASYANAQKLGLTLETINRVAVTQALVRGYNALRDAFSEAVTTAGEFEKRVALIQTINENTSFDRAAESIKAISTNFNIPLLETAKGVYNALSNQVGNFAETLKFTEEAAKFAKTTNSSLADSVDLLSGALRSYGFDSDQTNRVASVFFSTIDKGRVTADQLANSFGRVGPLAAQVGVSIEELGALIATISDKGVNTAETLTQVRAIFSGLLKPSDALKETLRELGFTSADVGIKTLGLVGFLNALRKTGGETSAELAQLFQNVRGLGGILSSTGNDANILADNLIATQEAVAKNLAGEKFKQATETNINTVETAFNRVKNNLIAVGTQFISTESQAITFFESINAKGSSFATAADAIISGAGGAAAAVVALGVAINGAALASKAFSTTLLANPLFLYAAGAGAATLALDSLIQSYKKASQDEALSQFFTNEAKAAENLKRVLDETTTTLGTSTKELAGLVRNGFADMSDEVAAYTAEIDKTKDANERLVSSSESAIKRIIDTRRSLVEELSKGVTDANKAIEQSQDRVFKLQQGRDTATFENNLANQSDPNKVNSLTNRARDLANQAARDLDAAVAKGNDLGIKRALEKFDDAQDAAQQAKSINDRVDARFRESKAVTTISDITAKQILAEQSLQRLSEERARNLEAEKVAQQAILKDVERQSKIVLDNTGQFDKDGNRFNKDELAKRATAREGALSKLVETEFAKGKFDLGDLIGVAEFKSKFQESLQSGPSLLRDSIEQQDLGITATIEDGLGKVNVTPLATALKKAFDIQGLITPEEIDALATRFQDQFTAKINDTKKGAGAQQTLEDSQKSLDSLFDAALKQNQRSDKNITGSLDFFGIGGMSAEIDEAIVKLRAFAKAGVFTGDEVKQVFQDLADKSKDVALPFQEGFDFDASLFKRIGDEFLQLQQASEDLKATNDSALDPARAAEFQSIMETLRSTIPVTESASLGVNISTAISNTAALTQQVTGLTQALQQAALAAASIRVPSGGGDSVFANFGSVDMRYFANVGFARGSDRIHAMLAPGESVINARATAKFKAQISAINARQMPSFRSDSGPVTNVGDINVNVNGGGTATQTAREIAVQLKREIRRGTSSL